MRVMSSRSNVKQRHVSRIEMFEGGEIGEIMFPENASVLRENAEDLEIEREDVSSSFVRTRRAIFTFPTDVTTMRILFRLNSSRTSAACFSM